MATSYVGMDLHRRRSVVVETDAEGMVVDRCRIANDPERLSKLVAEMQGRPDVDNVEVVLEATYGWYWAADVLQATGAGVHLAHPLGVSAFSTRRVKNDWKDAQLLADLARSGTLAEAWIAPADVRELREMVRFRRKLIGLRTNFKDQIHAVLAKHGIPVPMTDLFGKQGRLLLDSVELAGAYRQRVDACLEMIDTIDQHIHAADRRSTTESLMTPHGRPSRSSPAWGRS